MRERFVLCPGYVQSRSDGELHYVGVAQLQRLYDVRGENFEIAFQDEPWIRDRAIRDGLIPLAPRPDGQYGLGKYEAVAEYNRRRLADLDRWIRAAELRHPQPKRRTAVMVDLETMGTTPGSAIVSIGAVAFDPARGIGDHGLYVVVDLGSNALFGLREDKATRAWWAKQSPEARAVLDDPCRVPLSVALDRFDAFWRKVGGVEFWAHGPNFDETLLGAAYRAANRRPPWQFWNTRCTRTIYAAAGVSPDRAKGVHHNALDDAFNQAEAVVEAYRILGLGHRPLRWILARAWRRILRGRK